MKADAGFEALEAFEKFEATVGELAADAEGAAAFFGPVGCV